MLGRPNSLDWGGADSLTTVWAISCLCPLYARKMGRVKQVGPPARL